MKDSSTQTLNQAFEAYRIGDLARAYLLYRSLASQGHCESQVFVGWMLYEGKGVIKDPNEAMVWFRKAAALGYPAGAFYVGRSLSAVGNHHEAINWYQQAASSGYIPAVFRLGLSYARGKGVEIDLAKAYQLLTKAKKQGHVYAYRELARLDMEGNRGMLRKCIGFLQFIFIVGRGAVIMGLNPSSERLQG